MKNKPQKSLYRRADFYNLSENREMKLHFCDYLAPYLYFYQNHDGMPDSHLPEILIILGMEIYAGIRSWQLGLDIRRDSFYWA